MKLSENFSLSELTVSDTAMRNGYKEQYAPPAEVIANLKILAEKICEPIRAEFGSFSPTCAYRCPRLNRAVGGAAKSDHLIGLAIDETFADSKAVFLWAIKNLEFKQMIWEKGNVNQPAWLHIAYDPKVKKQKKEVLVLDSIGYRNYFDHPYYRVHNNIKI